ncbi:MAG: hypothetical protein JNM96_04335 [Bacteroidia bacterium]|nr:hypothetical protein [Bacteroidia bacterium]
MEQNNYIHIKNHPLADIHYFKDQKILISILRKDAPINYEDTLSSYKITHEITEGEDIVVLFDTRNLSFENVPKEVLNCMAKNEYNINQKQFAIIYEGIGQKLMGGLFTTLYKPYSKTKLFSNVKEAFEWLGISNPQPIIEKAGITL